MSIYSPNRLPLFVLAIDTTLSFALVVAHNIFNPSQKNQGIHR
jgi:hypothetical protein